MGYATTMYAVDLGKLKVALDSKDARLSRRVRRTRKLKDDLTSQAGPCVKVAKNSDLFLNRRKVSIEELRSELLKRHWKGTFLKCYFADKIRGAFSADMSFWNALALPHGQFQGFVPCNKEEELFEDLEVEEISEGQAVDELIAGEATRPDCAFQYGYALEHICATLGTHLATIEGKRGILSHLNLDTRLRKERSPVLLPEGRDFPVISYLSAEEVQREFARFRELNLAFPKNAEVEEDRKVFLKSLTKAAKSRAGIVAFYY